jgi:putative endonuclease
MRPRSGAPSMGEKLAAAESGRRAEQAVAEYLEAAGFVIVARNLRLGRLEIDIVARQSALIVVVEVRTRGEGAWTTALGSLDRIKRERIRRAGQRLWRQRYQRDPSAERMRFDAASVRFQDGRVEIEYVVAAF